MPTSRFGLLAAVAPLASSLFFVVGCSSSHDSASAADDDAGLSADEIAANEAQADTEYQTTMQQVSDAYQTCVDAQRCVDPSKTDGGVGDAPGSSTTGTADGGVETSDAGTGTDTDGGLMRRSGAAHTEGIVSNITGLFSSVPNKICSVLAPIQDYQQVFFFVGGSVSGGAGVVGQAGADEVWDLWDQQSAAFWYKGGGLASLVGVSASVYSGFGFGKNKANVIDAWSGYFKAGGVGVGTPVVHLGLSASIFVGSSTGAITDIDTSIVGGAISVDASLNALDALKLPIGGSVTQAYWTPWNPGTEAMGQIPWWGVGGGSSTSHGTAANGGSYEFTQYKDTKSLAYSLFGGSPGPLAVTASSLAVALNVLKTHKWTVKDICGASATQDAGAGSLVH